MNLTFGPFQKKLSEQLKDQITPKQGEYLDELANSFHKLRVRKLMSDSESERILKRLVRHIADLLKKEVVE